MTNPPIELIIFDLDGTLIHSAPDIVDTTNELLQSYGEPTLSEERIIRAIGEGLMPLIAKCFQHLISVKPKTEHRPMLEKINHEFYELYAKNLVKKTTVYPGIHDFLSQTTYKIAIVTNKYEDLTQVTLKKLDLHRYPWIRILGADSLTEKKPHPLPLLEVMKTAGVAPTQTVMIGDGLPDIQAALAAGTHAIACEYGYCGAEALRAVGARNFVKSPELIKDAITHL